MAQSKKRKSGGGKSGGRGRGTAPATVGGATGRPRRQGANPIKGMAVGGLVILLLAVFFFMQFGGKTPFNHLLGVFESAESTEAPAKAPAPQGKAPVRKPPAALAAKKAPARPAVARNIATAPAMERVSVDEQARLDDLIDKTAP